MIAMESGAPLHGRGFGEAAERKPGNSVVSSIEVFSLRKIPFLVIYPCKFSGKLFDDACIMRRSESILA
jgi:hypothetical protein